MQIRSFSIIILSQCSLLFLVCGCQMDTSGLDDRACSDQPEEFCESVLPGSRCVEGYCMQVGDCEPSTHFCDGDVLSICDENGHIEGTTDCQFGCNPNRIECNECTPNSTACQDDGLVTCDVVGHVETETDCDYGCNIFRIECNECYPDTTGCQGNDIVVCAVDGTVDVRTTCDSGCAGGQCYECQLDITECVGDDLVVCDAVGNMSVTHCAPFECHPQALRCNNCVVDVDVCEQDELSTCDDGLLTPSEVCDYGCNETQDDCNDCTPSTTECHVNDLVTCAADGTIEESTTCDNGCAAGHCISCDPSTTSCEGSDLVVCDEQGTAGVTPCGANGCNATYLRCNECLPDSSYCDEDSLIECSVDGLIVNQQTCVYDCNGVSSLCNICTPSTVQCHDNELVTCNADGTVASSETCAGGCVQGQCYSCQANTTVCEGTSLVVCDDQGHAVVTECEYGCNAAAGPRCNLCTPSQTECHEGVSVICDANGSILSETMCSTLDSDCTVGLCSDVNGACFADPTTGQPCENGDPCMASQCDALGACMNTTANPNVPCDGDDYSCSDDVCNANGECVSTPNPANCSGNELCLVQCAIDDTGCVPIPAEIELSCPAESNSPAVCEIDIGALANQEQCLTCSATIGITTLDYLTFEDEQGECDLGEWTQITDANMCYDDNLTVPMNKNCCNDHLCPVQMGDLGDVYGFAAEKLACSDDNICRLQRVFDTSDLVDIELCFDSISHAATDDWIAVEVVNVQSDDTFLWRDFGGPQVGSSDVVFRYCFDLPEWADDNAELEVRLFVRSKHDNQYVVIDNVELRGWHSSCRQTEIFVEDFTGCSSPLDQPWGAWTVNGNLLCLTSAREDCDGNNERLIADNTQGFIERTVDVSQYDADIRLCFLFGDDHISHDDDWLQVEFDTGLGTGWQPAWHQQKDMGPDQTCLDVCVNLTDIDPAAAGTANLKIRFSLSSNGDPVNVDHIRLYGTTTCQAGAHVSLNSPSFSTDHYDVQVSADGQLTTAVQCSWGSPSQVHDSSTIWFGP